MKQLSHKKYVLSFFSILTLHLLGPCSQIYSNNSFIYSSFTDNSQTILSQSKQTYRNPDHDHKIAVIGTGYVGLITGACLAKFGNNVTCVDIDSQKINNLNNGIMPIYEPGLSDVVALGVHTRKLSFSDNVNSAIQDADIIFIAVNTPMGDDGSADLSAFKSVIKSIARNLNSYKIIVTKSTVPIGTGAWIQQTFEQEHGIDPSRFDIVSNPEFLREGSAVNDFLYPDKIVIGTQSSDCDDKAVIGMKQIYKHLLDQNTPCVFTNIVTAESIKYACNSFLATKLSFINELANLSDKTGADTQTIAYAMGLDSRISKNFLNPGPGFGGSCFPKDTLALLYTAQQHGVTIQTIKAAHETNEKQKQIPVAKLSKLMNGDFAGKTIAVLGLAFKGNTDDVRYSPALTTIELLLKHGAHVKTYDPQAMDNTHAYFPDITYSESIEDAVNGADAAIVMTEWDEFKNLNLIDMAQRMRNRILVDTRNIVDTDQLTQLGFAFDTIGRSYLSNRLA